MSQWVGFIFKWGDDISSGWYYKLLADGKISKNDLEPEVDQYAFYRDSFIELSTCRDGEGPIPFTSIAEYSKIYNIVEEDFEDFHYIIRSMDKKLLVCIKEKKAKDKA
jgi:hypothetical protein